MKNAETVMAAFCNCCMVEENDLFAETLFHTRIFNILFQYLSF